MIFILMDFGILVNIKRRDNGDDIPSFKWSRIENKPYLF